MPITYTTELINRLLAEESRFDRDYQQHFLPEDSRPAAIGKPFFLPGSSACGVLLVHGLMAAPEEVREWGEYLHAQGYTVYAPRMAGHGTSTIDLANRRAEDWMASVEQGRHILECCCRHIVIAGFSTGGAVALESVIRHPEAFAAVISISAPLRFKAFTAHFAEPVHYGNRLLQLLGLGKYRKTFVRNHADNPHINYLRCPVSSIVQIKRLMRSIRNGLPTIRIPSLVMHADGDPKVDVRGGREIYHRLGSINKRYHEVCFHQHGIVRGEITREVFAEARDFLTTVMGSCNSSLTR